LRCKWYWRLVAAIALLLTVVGGAVFFRSGFDQRPVGVVEGAVSLAPEGVVALTDLAYRKDDEDALLDVYFPESANQLGTILPTVIWTHGGGWVTGHKDEAVPYFQLIAIAGYTVISLDYSLAPGEQYPTPIYQINDALTYIQENADRFHVDVNRLVMAGDSAGAQITSQIAAVITNPEFAAEMQITPALKPAQLRGVILHCGIYDMKVLLDKADYAPLKIRGWNTQTIVRAYTGSEAPDSPALRQMSTINHVTGEFPPTFISGGNDDRLTDDQSVALANKLEGLGVKVTALFYPEDYRPRLGHEYQFRLEDADAQRALTETLVFLKAQTN
jgi:acetyl esterase/lipase